MGLFDYLIYMIYLFVCL